MELSSKRILLTGGSGFPGCPVLPALLAEGVREVVAPRKADYDSTKEEAVARVYRDHRPDLVIHLLPVNLYGPRDNFHPGSSPVIPALMMRRQEAIFGFEAKTSFRDGLEKTIRWFRESRAGRSRA